MATATELRQAVSDLSTLAAADLHDMWRTVSSADEAQEALQDLLPGVTSSYSLAAATVAADWYDDLRDTLNVDGRFSALVADLGDLGAEALAGWATAPLRAPEPDWRRTRVLVEGGLQLRIGNAARNTITTSAVEDPQAHGWQRSASGGCPFCVMLAARGAVYSRATVDFAAHDHCRCVAVPAFDGHPLPVKAYTPTDRNITDADRARVRAYLAQHHAG